MKAYRRMMAFGMVMALACVIDVRAQVVTATVATGSEPRAIAIDTATNGSLPGAPMLSAPLNGSANQSVSLTLSWNSVSGATSYALQTSTSSTFSILNQIGDIASTSHSVSGLSIATTYYWQVGATNGTGAGPWSSVWSFTTANIAPVSPVLSWPSNGSTGLQGVVYLSWASGSGGGATASYGIQVSTASAFSSFIANQTGIAANNGLSLSGLAANTIYYWHANATNSGGTSLWSATWTFATISSAPSAPILSSPVNNAGKVSTSPYLYWNASSTASSYTVQISTTTDFVSFSQATITNIAFHEINLSINTVFYWRVSATNAAGTSPWSSVWSFTTSSVSVLSSRVNPTESTCFMNGTNLSYTLAQPSAVRIAFSDILGREKAVIDRFQSSGQYSLSLKTLNLSPGVYLVHFRAGNRESVMKVMVSGR